MCTNSQGGDFEFKIHKTIIWIPLDQINQYDFSPADIPFIDKIRRGDIEN